MGERVVQDTAGGLLRPKRRPTATFLSVASAPGSRASSTPRWAPTVNHRLATEAMLAACLIGGAVVHAWPVDGRLGFLYFYFLPATVAAVLFGRVRGLLYAGLAVAFVGIQILARGLPAAPTASTETETTAVVVLWGICLAVTAYVAGYVSETGGNRGVVQEIGNDAMATVERERRRTAFDIHDGVAQTATTALMQVEVLDALTEEAEPPVKEQVHRVRETLIAATQEIRAMIGNMRPPNLAGPQFETTLSGLIDDFAERTGIPVDYTYAADLGRKTDSLRICVFRVVQEALSNIERHACASRVWVSLSSTRFGVLLIVADDGTGFDLADVESAAADGHFGIVGIRERVMLLAGRVSIKTAPGEGTTIKAYIPDYSTR